MHFDLHVLFNSYTGEELALMAFLVLMSGGLFMALYYQSFVNKNPFKRK